MSLCSSSLYFFKRLDLVYIAPSAIVYITAEIRAAQRARGEHGEPRLSTRFVDVVFGVAAERNYIILG